jgi:hypothetical protein
VYRAKAGIQFLILFKYLKSWMPALHHTRYRARFRGHDKL